MTIVFPAKFLLHLLINAIKLVIRRNSPKEIGTRKFISRSVLLFIFVVFNFFSCVLCLGPRRTDIRKFMSYRKIITVIIKMMTLYFLYL